MMKNRAGWLALIVLAVASLLMVFFVLPRINQDGKPIGDAINAAGNAVKEAVTEPQQAAKAPEAPNAAGQADAPAAPSAPQASSAAQPATPETAQTPTGETATSQGSAAPSFDVLRVEPDGSTVVAGRAQPNSTLEVTSGTAVVGKVDVGPSGDFAAVLDKPLPPGDHQLVLKATGKDGKSLTSEEIATVSVPADRSGKLLAMVTKPGKASRVIAMPVENGAAPTNQQSASASSTGAAASISPASATSSPAAGELPALPAGSSDLASVAPNIDGSQSTSPLGEQAAGSPDLRVTAVEIEGRQIFIAGVAKPGVSLRGEADGNAIGTAKAAADGHFVIEGTGELSVGDHRITVEVLGADGQPQLRVEVPFNRPAGEQVAAVAGSQVSTGMSVVDGGAFDKLRNETLRAFNLLQGLYEDGKQPSPEDVAAARSATSIALKSLTEYRLPADAAEASRAVAEAAAREAAAALAALDALPRNVDAVGSELKRIGGMVALAVGPAIAEQLEGVEVAAGTAGSATEADGAKTIQQAPLTQSGHHSVIIRRGDTLWQISRRVYGQGVRYTTIYLANEEQITNPDIIQPGQIFGVPDEYRPDSEELHRQRMMNRRS